MRVFIDANIIADALLTSDARPGGDRASAIRLLDAVSDRTITGIITAPIFAFVVHIVKPRSSAHRKRMEHALEYLLDIMEWSTITPAHCRTALASTFHDVEDGMEFFSCYGLDAIVTRDVKDYRDNVNVEVLTATEFVEKHLK